MYKILYFAKVIKLSLKINIHCLSKHITSNLKKTVMKKLCTLTDDELVRAYVDGNDEAFDTLLNRYQNKLYSYILFLVHNEELANDVFQETFVKAIVMLQQQRYVFSGKFCAWIMRIAHNLIIDSFRQEKKENLCEEDLLSMPKVHAMLIVEDNIETHIVREQSWAEVRSMIARLPESQKEIVLMRFYQNLSFKEIADKLGISINTALGRMRYALINLRKIHSCNHLSDMKKVI